jgi:dTDP-4-dehydrorhamnose reductase
MVPSVFDSEKPDLVFNCAAMTNVDLCETKEDIAYAVNVTKPANIAHPANSKKKANN